MCRGWDGRGGAYALDGLQRQSAVRVLFSKFGMRLTQFSKMSAASLQASLSD